MDLAAQDFTDVGITGFGGTSYKTRVLDPLGNRCRGGGQLQSPGFTVSWQTFQVCQLHTCGVWRTAEGKAEPWGERGWGRVTDEVCLVRIVQIVSF